MPYIAKRPIFPITISLGFFLKIITFLPRTISLGSLFFSLLPWMIFLTNLHFLPRKKKFIVFSCLSPFALYNSKPLFLQSILSKTMAKRVRKLTSVMSFCCSGWTVVARNNDRDHNIGRTMEKKL